MSRKSERKNKNKNIFKAVLILACFLAFFVGVFPQKKAKAAITKQISYQGKLTNAAGVAVTDGNYSMKISIYDAATGGSCLWTARGTCGTPTARTVAVANGIFSIMLGDTVAGDNAIALDFNSPYYLGVTVGSDAEMGPSRKPISASGYAFNSDLLDGLDSATSGATSHILATDSGGGITAVGVNSGTGLIQGTGGLTITGAAVSLNASSNFAINIATGTSTGTITLGGTGAQTIAIGTGVAAKTITIGNANDDTFSINSSGLDVSTAGALSGITTIGMSGQLTSTLATGTAPFAVTSTTVNTNLNADLLDGQHGSYYLSAASISGTANRIAKFTGATSLGNSGINDLSDALAMTIDASENVGIGTTGPNNKLHIYDGTNITPSASAVGQLGILGLGYSGYIALDGTAMYLGHNSSSRNLTFQTDETDRMTVTGSGNVGIGTTSPGKKLVIADAVNTLSIGDYSSTSYGPQITSSNNSIVFPTSTYWGNSGMLLQNSSSKFIMRGDHGTQFDYYDNISAYKTAMIISGSDHLGNVMVGDTTPTANFQVGQRTAGAGTISNSAGGTTVTGVGTQFTNTFKVGDTITANGETHTIATIVSNTSLTTDAWTGANAGVAYTLTGGTRFSVLGNGNVGIGTTNPGALLHVGSTNPTIRYTQINNNGQLTVNYNNDGASTPLYIKNLDTTVGISQSVDMQAYFARTGDSTSRIGGYLRFGKEQEWTSTAATNDSFMSFGIANDGSSTERMRLTAVGYLGIGTTIPSTPLYVSKSTAGAQTMLTLRNVRGLTNDTAALAFQITTGDVEMAKIEAIRTDAVTAADTDLSFSAWKGGTGLIEVMRINARGNVGIGTTSPSSMLHVSVSNTEGTPAINGSTSGIFQRAATSASNNYVSILSGSLGISRLGFGDKDAQSAGYIDYNNSDNSMSFGLNGASEKMRIDNAGNVGIGTTTPTFNLQVVGTIGASGQITSTLATGTSPFAVTSTTVNTNLNADLLDGNHASAFQTALTNPVTGTGTANRIAKFTGTSTLGNSGINDLSDALAMTIDASENVGIGTTSPTSALEVLSSVYPVIRGTRTSSGTNTALAGFDILQKTTSDMVDEFGAMLSFSIEDSAAVKNNIGAIGAIRSGADNKGSLVFRVSNASADPTTEVMRITNSGNVGIGTTGPNAKLDIVGRLRVSDESSGADYGRIFTGNSGGLQAMHFVSGTNIPLAFAVNNGSPSMVLNTNGNVGIGTTNPTLKTHIIGTSGYPATSGTTQTGILRLGNSAGTQVLDIGQNNANGYAWLQSTSNSDLSATWPLLLNPNGGNVGIGTTSPGAKLDVSGNGASIRVVDTSDVAIDDGGYISLYGNYNTGYTPFEWARIKGGKQTIAGEAAGYLAFSTAYGTGGGVMTERMRIKQDGNVGIGTTNPGALLQIGSRFTFVSDGIMNWGSSANQGRLSWDTGKVMIYGQVGNALQLSSNGNNTQLYLNTDGNVGIGTTAPGSALDIYGKIKIFNNGTLSWGTTADQGTLTWDTGRAIINAQGTNDLVFATGNNSEKIRILNGGNVGIGTTNPTYLLHVNGGDIYTSGDMRIAGDDLFMATNTAGYLLVADGTNFNPVAMSGDVTITSAGATAISANAVALSTDTTGNYVATITGGSGISSTGATSGEGIAHALSLGTLTADWSQTGAFDISLANAFSELKIMESAGATYYGIFDVGDLSADQIYSFTTGGTVWTSGNDGSGSTLDADTLDGHDTSYFQTALTNPVTGTGTNGYNAYWTGTNTIGGEQYTAVSRGGTGAGTFTAGGILYGNGASAIGATSVLANGQLLIGDGSGVPTLGTLTDGTAITITEGAGTITIGVTADSITDTQLAYNTGQHLTTTSSPTFASVIAANFRDSTGAYNVNLGSGGSEGRGLVAGYSGGSYGGIGYNVRHTATGGSYIAPLADTSSYLLFTGGSFSFLGAAAGTAGRALTYTAADITAGTYNSQTISSAASFTGTLTAATSLSAPRLISTVATGTAPFAVTSTTVNTNLNADLLDGQHAAAFLTGNQTITLSGDASGSGATAITVTNNLLTREDNRAINPAELAATKMKFGFTSWNNDSTSPYADFIHMRSYQDATGGSDNLLMFNRGVIGMRLWQQTYGSATNYSVYKDVVMTDQNSTNVTLAGTLTTNGIVVLGDGGDTVAVNSSSWDISSVGAGTGFTAFTVDNIYLNGTTIGHTSDTDLLSLASGALTVNGTITATSTVSGTRLISTIATGTSPLSVTSTTVNTNLNADLLDGYHYNNLPYLSSASGTTNYLAKFTGSNAIGNSLIYDNGTSVGIGTTAPAALLSVGATSQFQVSTAGAVTAVGVNSGTGLIQGTGGLTITGAAINLNASSNFAVNIATGTSTGAVTIGGNANTVAVNSSVWDITTAGVVTGLTGITSSGTITFSGLGTGTDNTVVILNSSNQLTTDEIDSRVWGSTLVDYSTTTANYLAKFSDTNTITNSIVYDNGTNVGIGTTSPGAKLEIAGGEIINGASGGASSYLQMKSGGTNIAILGSDASIYGGVETNIGLYVYNANQFDISTSNTKRFSITGAGNVGIGTTSPTYNLQVAGTLGLSGQLTSTLADGTAPFAVTSTTLNTNLNADLLDGKEAADFALTSHSVYYIEGTGSVAGTWLGADSDITAYYDGLTLKYYVPIAGASTTTLNINSLGAKTVYLWGASKLTTHYPAGSVVNLTYSTTKNGGCWFVEPFYADGTESYTVRWSSILQAGTAPIYDYKLVMFGAADGKVYPLTLEEGTATTKTVASTEFLLSSPILWYGTTTNIAANGTSQYYFYEGATTDSLHYTANQASGWTAYTPIYLKGTITSSGTFQLAGAGTATNPDNQAFMTQTLPTTEDGFVYILLGHTYTTTTSFRLSTSHPIYEYKGGKLRPYASEADTLDTVVARGSSTSSAISAPTFQGNSAAVTFGNASYTTAITSSDWAISTTGAMTGIGAITMNGLLTGTAGATLTGAAINLNASSNFAINIGTGTSTGAVTIGGGSNTVAINSSDWDISTAGAMTGISGITNDGTYTQSGTNTNTFTGTTTFSNATYSALFTGGNVGIGTTTPTASLQIKAGSSTAGTAPLKLTSGTNLTTAEAGAFEYNGTDLFFTPSGTTRETIAYLSDITASTHNAVTIGAFGSTPNANGLSLATQVLSMQPADGTNPGGVSTTTQTFAGAKTFSSLLTGSAGLTITGAAVNLNASSNFAINIGTGTSTGAITIGGGTATQTVAINSADWDISTTGAMTGISGITNDAAITSTGGIISLNASSNYAVNIATGTSTGAVSIGGNANTVAIDSSDWNIDATGAMTGIGAITMNGLLTGTAGATLTGAAINLNASSNFAINIGTGTSTGAVTIGGGSNTFAVASTGLDISTAGAISGATTVVASGTITAPNFADATGTYNVNLGSGGSEGRGLVAGYSGSSYGGIGFNVRHTTTGGQWIAPSADTSSYILFTAGGFNFKGEAAGTAGRTLAYSNLATLNLSGQLTLLATDETINGIDISAGAVSDVTTLGISGQLTSTLATGTSPFAVTSTTVNTNLNADLLDGNHASAFQIALTNPVTGTGTNGYNAYWTGTNTIGSEQYVAVSRGGTGAGTFTTGGILYGNGTSAIGATAVLTNGQLLIGDGSGVPTLATLTDGTAITITEGAGSITIGVTADSIGDTQLAYNTGQHLTTTSSPTFAGATLTLPAANKLYLNGSTTANTTTAGVLDIDVTSVTTNNVGSYLTYNSNAGAAALTQYASRIDMTYGTNASFDNTGYAQYINITQTDAAATAWGLYVNGEDKNYFSGNVGIGTTTSTYKLHVVGNTYLNGTTTSTGLITGNAGLTITGAAVNLNASSNFAVNIATGTSTGAVTIGGNANTVAVNSSSWDISSVGAGTGFTAFTVDNIYLNGTTIGHTSDTDLLSLASGALTVNGTITATSTISGTRLISTIATGTAPFAVTSTTVNTNLNADLLDGYHYNNLPYLGSASGTTNYIAKFTGSNAIGNSLVYDNGTNVSIGTTSAANLLSLQKAGTAKANLNIFSLTNSGNAADMDGTLTSILFNQYYYNATTPAIADSGNITVGTETDWTSTASTQDSFMSFSTALDGTITEYMRITSAGNVGIGTTSPGRTIDVVGNWGGNTIFHQATEGTTYTITTKALGYYFFRPNLGLDTAVTTYNITGLPDTDGTFAFIRATCNVAVYLKVQINGVQISQTAAATHTYTVLRMNGEWHIIGSKGNGSDLAEWMETSGERPMPGELVTIAEKPEQVEKAILSERKNLVGIVATSPHTTMGEASDTSVQVALSGRVPTFVTNINGPIKNGDPITISQIDGYGAKATTSGLAVGKAMENFDPETTPEKIVACPANSPEGAICGKIVVFVNLDWGEVEMTETDLANIAIKVNERGVFELVQPKGEKIEKMDAFDSLIIGKLKTGETSSNVLNVNRICLNNDCKDSWDDLTKSLDDQLVFVNEKIASIENTEAIQEQKFLSLENELLWLTDTALIQEKSLTSFQSNLINLGIRSNDIRNEISLLSNKLSLFKSSAEPEKVELEKLNNETGAAKTTLEKAVYSDAAFGGEYASPGEYREISIDWQETKDLSQYDMKSGNLEFELYLEKANLFEDFNAELGNIQDEQEIQWKKATFPWLVDGWNTVKLSIGSGYEIGQVDWQKISHFRLFFKFKGENNLKIRNVKIEAQKKTDLNPGAIFALNGESIELNSMENQNTLILALDTKMSEMNSKIGNQQELIDSIQAQVNDINNRNEAYELNVAKIEETANETSLFKRILGLDRAANAGDVDILGKLSAEKTESGQMLIKVSEEAKRTIGESAITEVKIDANDDKIDDETGSDGKKVFVESLMANSKSKVFVTSKKATSQSLAVTSIIEKQGFWVEVENPVKEDLEFDWWMVEEKDVIAP